MGEYVHQEAHRNANSSPVCKTTKGYENLKCLSSQGGKVNCGRLMQQRRYRSENATTCNKNESHTHVEWKPDTKQFILFAPKKYRTVKTNLCRQKWFSSVMMRRGGVGSNCKGHTIETFWDMGMLHRDSEAGYVGVSGLRIHQAEHLWCVHCLHVCMYFLTLQSLFIKHKLYNLII